MPKASSALLVLALFIPGCLSDGASRPPTDVEVGSDGVAPGDTATPPGDATGLDTAPAPDTAIEPDMAVQPDTAVEPDTSPEPDTAGPTDEVLITSDHGDETLPGSVVQLGVEVPAELEPVITGYRWSVEQPAGSAVRFMPNEFVPAPTFEAWVVGTYVFHLDLVERVEDEDRIRRAGSFMMRVSPNDALHVELTWRTPNDGDETDTGGSASYSVGSDVDLHVLHPSAEKYFDWTYDCYWENTNPEWGAIGPLDNPMLDRDDTDGAGPEVISIERPEALTYRVGVHYWNDWAYGEAFATVRIFWGGVLLDQWETRVVNGDLWESHLIDAATATVTRLTADGSDAPRVTPQYPFSPGYPF